jgi:hypothetical protein
MKDADMSKVAAYRTAVLACTVMSLSAQGPNQIALVLVCWCILGLIHDKVVDQTVSVHARRWSKIMWLAARASSPKSSEEKAEPLDGPASDA